MSDKDPMIELIRHVRDVCAEAVAGNRYDPFEDDTCDASDDVRELDPSRILARARALRANAIRGGLREGFSEALRVVDAVHPLNTPRDRWQAQGPGVAHYFEPDSKMGPSGRLAVCGHRLRPERYETPWGRCPACMRVLAKRYEEAQTARATQATSLPTRGRASGGPYANKSIASCVLKDDGVEVEFDDKDTVFLPFSVFGLRPGVRIVGCHARSLGVDLEFDPPQSAMGFSSNWLRMQASMLPGGRNYRPEEEGEASHEREATRDPELDGGVGGDPAPVGLTNASTSFPYFEGWFPNFLEQSPLGPTLLSLEKDEETWFAVYHTIKAAWLQTPGFIDDPDDCLAGIDPARVESLDFEPCGHCKACEAGAAEVEAAGVVSVERVPAAQVVADAPCAHPRTYYNADTDNFYCVDCRKGMGLIYYAANITQVKESIAARKVFYGTFERQNAHCDGSGQLSGYAGDCAGCIACNHSICRTALEAAYKEIARGQTATRLPRIAGQPEHQKDTGWAADPFAQLERLADYCNAVDMVDEDSNDVPIVDAVIGVLKDHQRLLVSLSDPRGDNEAVSYDDLCDELARCLQDLSAIADGDHDNGDQRCWKAYDRALKVWDQATGTSPADPATPDPTVVDEGQDHE